VIVLVAAGAVWALTHKEGDVFNPKVGFQDEPTETPAPSAPAPRKRGAKDPLRNFVWATYGYTNNRRRYLPASPKVGPPFRRRWYYNAHSLLEFSPSMAEGKLYVLKNDGTAVALDKNTGKVRWSRRVGTLAASTPGYGAGWVYVSLLNRGRGAIPALRARDGKVLWRKPLPSRSESSPVVDGGRVYFGSEDGTVYALDAATGARRWTFHASGAVKCGLALSGGRLFFGDYSGRVYAIRARDGHQVWSTGTSGSLFGLRSGQFYSTPAVAFGRVYIGNTDHRMYSLSAATGKLAWTKSTGSYVYSSPAVAEVPGTRPTVYFGSYDGNFYAVDARSGNVRWTHHDGNPISGGASIVGDVVYYSSLRRKDTTGLNVRTGRKVFSYPHGEFNPVVSDGRTMFLTGTSSLYALRGRR
jgi:outer membrane protein assembly factor BamB